MASTARALWTENEEAVTRDVRGFLFIRDDREWLIAGQAWDLETSVKVIPADLASAPAYRARA